MARADEERQGSNFDALAAPKQAPPRAAVPRPRPVLDSGATIHAVYDDQFLSITRYLRTPKRIMVADGHPVQAYAVGDIDTEEFKLDNVYLAPDLKKDLVSVRELAKAGIITTFYKNHAELWKGTEMVGRAIAEGDLYELKFLRATGDDASDLVTPEVPSGTEPWIGAAVNFSVPVCQKYTLRTEPWIRAAADDSCLPKIHFENSPLTVDDFAVVYGYLEKKYTEYSYLMSKFKSLDDTAVHSGCLKPEYIRYSKFYQSDKTDGMHEVDIMESLKD